VPVPKGHVVEDEDDAVEVAETLGWPVVVKPLDASHGRGVLTNIRDESELRVAYSERQQFRTKSSSRSSWRARTSASWWCTASSSAPPSGSPPSSWATARRTIAELVERANKDPRRGIGHEKVLTMIEIDDLTTALLARRKLTPSRVPAAGETVFLKSTANLSTGGISRDVTDSCTPRTSTSWSASPASWASTSRAST
jgi:cyanophycin synthetase